MVEMIQKLTIKLNFLILFKIVRAQFHHAFPTLWARKLSSKSEGLA